MTDAKTPPPPRGDAAYRASLKEIAKRNAAAQAAAGRRRDAKEAASARDAARLAQLEARSLPRQPGR